MATRLKAVREDGHVPSGVVGLDHHLDGDVLVGKIAAGLALCISLAVELERRSLLQTGLVGLALHIEVGGALQVVVFDILGEVEDDVVAYAQHSVLRVGTAEELRTSRVLHAGEHPRLVGEECTAVSAEQHGPQVVGFLHDGALAEEAGGDVAVLGNHRLRAAGGSIEGGVGIVAAKVRPVVVAACRRAW